MLSPKLEQAGHKKFLNLASFACGDDLPWIVPLAKLLEAASRGCGHLPWAELRGAQSVGDPPQHLICVVDGLAMLPKTADAWNNIRSFFAKTLQEKRPRLDNAKIKAELDSILPHSEDNSFSNEGQRRAIAALVDARVGVLTGGPGTGKTTTAAALLAVYRRMWPELQPEDIMIGAPTGKAANRLRQSLLGAAQRLKLQPEEIDFLKALSPSTLHRALRWNGSQPENGGPFKFNRNNKLPKRLILVDEVSMVDTLLMSQLVDAIDLGTSLILLGDADQLDSVEAGGVLAELVLRGAALPSREDQQGLHARCQPCDPKMIREGLANYSGEQPLPGLSWGLVHSWRAKSAPWILECARASRPGKCSGAQEFKKLAQDLSLRDLKDEDVRPASKMFSFPDLQNNRVAWLEEKDEFYNICLLAWQALLAGSARLKLGEALDGQAMECLLGEFQLLCAFNHQVDQANQWAVKSYGKGQLCHGFPIMVEENRLDLGVVNGDVGIAIGKGLGELALVVVFPGLDKPLPISHLPKYRLAFAMTIHKSQGSEWKQVAVDIPNTCSELLEPRLLYTAITRASAGLVFHAPPDGLRQILGE